MLEYIQFLYPVDGIQKLFFFLIAGLSIGTAIWILIVAKEKNWEYNWLGETPEAPQDDLDVEHGSVFDLSEAIATRGEKFAAVLPSMLLVIGLLGTFLGVGFSLDTAAGILSNKGDEPMALLQKMMPMLDGMGALFKSSIYGIIFFFLFSAFRSIIGTEKKRLKFCIEKCNTLITKKRAEEKTPIIMALEKVSSSLGNSLQDVLINVLNEGMKHINASLDGMSRSMQDTISSGFKSVRSDLTKVANKTAETAGSLNSLNNTMTESFKSVEESAKKMGSASTSLKKSVDEFAPRVQATLNEIQKQFVASIEESGKIMEGAGVSIKNAVEEMAMETHNGQEELRKTLKEFEKKMGSILVEIEMSAGTLQESSDKTKDEMEKIRKDIVERLQSVSVTNTEVRQALKGLPEGIEKLNFFLDNLKEKTLNHKKTELNENRLVKNLPRMI